MLNLGNITFGLAVNTTGLDAGARTLEGFGRRVDQAMQRASQGIEYNTAALRRQEAQAVRGLQQVQNLASRIQNMRIDPQVKTDQITALQRAYADLARTMATPVNRTLDPLTFQRAALGFKEQIDSVNRAVASQATVSNQAANNVAAAFQRQEMAAMRAAEQVRSLNDQISRAISSGAINQKTGAALIERANMAGSQFGSAMNAGTAFNPKQMLENNLRLRGSLDGVRRDMLATASAGAPMSAALHAISDSAALVIGPLNGVVFRLRASHEMMDRYGMAVGATAAAIGGLTIAFLGLGQQILQTEIAYQKSEVILEGLTQNSAIAAAELDYLREVSMRAGLSFNFLAPQFAQFVAAAQGSGMTLAYTNEQFEKMAMIGGTLHFTADQFNRVMLAFDQMLSAGRIFGDDMRQLRNVMPGAFEVAEKAAKQLGVTLRDEAGKFNEALDPAQFIDAFLDQYVKLFNIDLNEPIETLQAELNRIVGSWEMMILAFSRAVGASEAMQAAFELVSGGLQWMALNMDLVIAAVGAITGAFTGLFAVMLAHAAFTAVMGFFQALGAILPLITLRVGALTGGMFGLGVAQTGATLSTAQLTAAQAALNGVMMANPILRVVQGLALLAGAIGGAILGYNTLNKAVTANNAAMADTSGIDAYIAAQKELGYQVESVTIMMIKQAQVASAANLASLNAMRVTHQNQVDARNRRPVQGGVAAASGGMSGFNPFGAGSDRELAESTAGLNRMSAIVQQDTARLRALTGILDLPEFSGGTDRTPTGDGGGKDKKAADLDRGLRRIKDVIAAAQQADDLLANMWRGPTHSNLIESLTKVDQLLNDLDPAQFSRLSEELTAAGYQVDSLGGVADTLAVIMLNTEAATEAVKRYNKVWEELQEGVQELENINEQIRYLAEGGDPEQMWWVEGIQRARETIRTLTTQDLPTLRDTLTGLLGADGQRMFNDSAIDAIIGGYEESDLAGLAALKGALESLGYTGATTEEALARFYNTLGQGNASLSAAQSFFGTLNGQVEDFNNTLTKIALLQGGAGLQDVLNLDYLQRAQEATRYLDETSLEGLRNQLMDLGIAGDDVNVMLATFYRISDENARQADVMTSVLRSQTEAWTEFSSAGVESFRQIIMAGESFEDTMLKLLGRLGETILNAAIFDPLEAQLNDIVSGMLSGDGRGFGDIGGAIGKSALRFFGLGGKANESDAAIGNTMTDVGLEAFTSALQTASNTMQVDFLTALFRSGASMSTETSATVIHTAALNSATMAVLAFTAALATSAATKTATMLTKAAMMGFAEGGQVHGPGTPTSDSIPIWVSDKEFVVNAQATKDNLALLHMINGGKKFGNMMRFAQGGQVDASMIRGSYGNYDGPTKSVLTSQPRSIKMDNRTSIHIHGNVGQSELDRLEAMLDERDQRLREDLPLLVDERVVDSTLRGRI